MLDLVMDLIVSILLMGMSFLGGVLARGLKKSKKRQAAMEDGLRALLRDSIIHECDRCADRGYMHIHNLESVEDMSRLYYILDGNGAISKLVQDFKKLEVK